MSKKDQFHRARTLLSQALSVAANSLGEGQSVVEAKSHIRQALTKLERAEQRLERRRDAVVSQFKEWHENTVAAQPVAPMSHEAAMRVLGNLESMIDAEKQKLAELENQSQEGDDQLLQD